MKQTQGEWTALPSLNESRSHPAVAACEQRIHVIGGGAENFRSLDGHEVFDTGSNTWETARPMPTKRSGTACFNVDGRLFVVGGGFKKPDGNFQFLPTVEIYDPQTDSWEQGPDMHQPHDYPAAVYLNNALYILGGHHPEACLGGPKTDPGFDFCERLNLSSGNWETLPPLLTPRFAATAWTEGNTIFASGGVAFRAGDFSNFDFVETWQDGDDSWARPEEPKLPWPAAGHGIARADNHTFFFGGYSTDDIHNRAACYDPAGKQWQRLPDMPVPRAAMGVAVIDRAIYLLGGWADDGRTPIDSVVKYEW